MIPSCSRVPLLSPGLRFRIILVFHVALISRCLMLGPETVKRIVLSIAKIKLLFWIWPRMSVATIPTVLLGSFLIKLWGNAPLPSLTLMKARVLPLDHFGTHSAFPASLALPKLHSLTQWPKAAENATQTRPGMKTHEFVDHRHRHVVKATILILRAESVWPKATTLIHCAHLKDLSGTKCHSHATSAATKNLTTILFKSFAECAVKTKLSTNTQRSVRPRVRTLLAPLTSSIMIWLKLAKSEARLQCALRQLRIGTLPISSVFNAHRQHPLSMRKPASVKHVLLVLNGRISISNALSHVLLEKNGTKITQNVSRLIRLALKSLPSALRWTSAFKSTVMRKIHFGTPLPIFASHVLSEQFLTTLLRTVKKIPNQVTWVCAMKTSPCGILITWDASHVPKVKFGTVCKKHAFHLQLTHILTTIAWA
jgi:hypothetical protein